VAIGSFLIADVLYLFAAASWIWFDTILAVVLFFLAVALTMSAVRCLQVAGLRKDIESRLDRGQSVLAELGGRRHRRFSWFVAPLFLVLTEDYFYAFDVGLRPEPPTVRRAYSDVMAVHLGTKMKAATLQIELPDQTLEIVGIMQDELGRVETVLKAKRPSAVQPDLADAFRELNAD
jgi:hypothetical protein